MDDDPFEEDSPTRPERASDPERALEPAGAARTAVAPPADGKLEPPSRKAGGLPERWRKARSAVRNFFSGPEEPRPLLVTGLALAIAVMVALALYAVGYPVPGSSPRPPSPSTSPGAGGEGADRGGGADPFAASAPNLSSPAPEAAAQEVAYVSASLLICRETPDDRARRVRNLLRGREVRVLGYDGSWASLAYRGGQCWAQAQYLSPVPPI